MKRRCCGGRTAWACLLTWLALLSSASPVRGQGNSTAPSTAPAAPTRTTEGDILLTFKAGVSNWAAKTQRFKGWQNASESTCSWTGVACSSGLVTGLALPNLGLVGTLPESLGNLKDLQLLDLGGNQLNGTLSARWGSANSMPVIERLLLGSNVLRGTLPQDWGRNGRFRALKDLTLHANRFGGGLPTAWGTKGPFKNLASLDLSNNSFTGELPAGWGANGSFPALAILLLSNNSLSGPLPPAWGAAAAWPALASLDVQNNDFEGGFPATWGRPTALKKLDTLLLQPGNSGLCGMLPTGKDYTVQYTSGGGRAYPLTGTLGSCATTCGTLTTNSTATNLYDISLEAQVALADLLQLNPSVNVNAAVMQGTSLTRPCYGSNDVPSYLGANIAYGKVASQSSTVEDGAAGAAVDEPQASMNGTCTQTEDGTQQAPAWWSLDLGVSTDIVGLVIATQVAVNDLKIAIGDSDSPLENAECSVGVQVEANATSAQVCNGKGRYLTLSRLSGQAISLCGIEVYPVAANAAISKNATASAGTNASLATTGAGNACAAVTAASDVVGAWLTVDLAYTGSVVAIAVNLGPQDLMGLSLRVGDMSVTDGTENPPCAPAVANLPGYSKTLFACKAEGRYVTVQAPAAAAMDLCLVSVFLSDVPGVTNGSDALTPASDLILAPGPPADALPAAPDLAPGPEAFAPDQMVDIVFRLVLIGPTVVEFDGKESAVINALNATLAAVSPANIKITSYTVGAPVPQTTEAPAPAIEIPRGRRLMAHEYDLYAGEEEGAVRGRALLQPVSEGAVIINVVVRTTAAKEEATVQLMRNSVNNDFFTKALKDAGLDATAATFTLAPSSIAPDAVPAAAPGEGPSIPIPASSGGGKSAGAAIGGGVAAGVVALATLAALLWWLLARWRRRRQDAAAANATIKGGGGDIESASDTGSSSRSGDGGAAQPGCWPGLFSGRSKAQQQRQRGSLDSRGEVYSDKLFLPRGAEGSSKLREGLPGQVYAHARGAPGPLGPSRLSNGSHSGPGTPGAASHTGTEPADDVLRTGTSAGGSSALLLPAGAFARSESSGMLGSPSGWETPLGMGPGGPNDLGLGPGFLSPEQQMAFGGPLGLLRGVSDVASEVEVVAEEPPAQRWTSTSAELWPIMYRELTFLKQIGEGSFGRVYMARWRETTVAVKVLHRQTGDHQDDDLPLDPCPSAGSPDPILHALQKEAGIMASVRHPNVISYLGVCAEPACIVTEYCSKGSLTDVLRRGRASAAHAAALDWPRRLNMAMDAAKGMLHLHLCDPPIIHRDLKSPNLLVDKHWKLKVCDFNLSRVMEESVVLSSMVASNPRWLAPEILAGLPYTVAADVYSFGVIMWELLTWEVPWHQQNTWQVHAMVTVEKLRPDIPADCGTMPGGTFGGIEAYLELMAACWAQEPKDRPDFETVIGRLRRMLAVETLAREPSNAGSANGSPSRNHDRPAFNPQTASAPGSSNVAMPLAMR